MRNSSFASFILRSPFSVLRSPLLRDLLDRRLVGGVIVRRERLELGGAGIDQLVDRLDAAGLADAAHFGFAGVPQGRQLTVDEAVLLGRAQQVRVGRPQAGTEAQ